MRRLLMLTLLVGLLASVGCKDDKTIAPKDVPAAPKGPPSGVGAKPSDSPANKSGSVSP